MLGDSHRRAKSWWKRIGPCCPSSPIRRRAMGRRDEGWTQGPGLIVGKVRYWPPRCSPGKAADSRLRLVRAGPPGGRGRRPRVPRRGSRSFAIWSGATSDDPARRPAWAREASSPRRPPPAPDLRPRGGPSRGAVDVRVTQRRLSTAGPSSQGGDIRRWAVAAVVIVVGVVRRWEVRCEPGAGRGAGCRRPGALPNRCERRPKDRGRTTLIEAVADPDPKCGGSPPAPGR